MTSEASSIPKLLDAGKPLSPSGAQASDTSHGGHFHPVAVSVHRPVLYSI